ncbi:hypothetical protein YPPY113_1900, partial [Yersinia pestis PY-113]
MDLVFC